MKSTEQLKNLLKIHEFQYEKIEAFIIDALPFYGSRVHNHLVLRQALMVYLKYCDMGPSKIGGIFNKNHATVINALKMYQNEVSIGFGPITERFIKLVEEAHAFVPYQNLDDIGLLEYCSLAQLETYFLKGEKTIDQPFSRPFKNMFLNVIVLCKNPWDFYSYIKINEMPNKRYHRLYCCADIKDSFFTYDDIVRTQNFKEEDFDRPRLLQAFLDEYRENKKK
jgi:hypothetical protein